jgi:hypothetical protein
MVERLDKGSGGSWIPSADVTSTSTIPPPPSDVHESQAGMPSAAPVFVIRDVASEAAVQRHHVAGWSQNPDIIAKGLVPVQHAGDLIEMSLFRHRRSISMLIQGRFQEHYGRWVSFNPSSSSETILTAVRKSPLHLCVCCLFTIQHKNQRQLSLQNFFWKQNPCFLQACWMYRSQLSFFRQLLF